ncbi:MAG: asparagine synthase-related protein [Burkholderiales bacterium]
MGHRGSWGRTVELAREAGNGVVLWVCGPRTARADAPGTALATDPATAVHAALAGTLYNAAAIGRELDKAGVPGARRGDAEVALRAYLVWGRAALDRLEGAYALAFLDPRSGEVLLARDRLGVRPLYFARTSGAGATSIMFASEIRALIATGLVPRKLDRVAFETLVWNGFVMSPNTMVEGVEAVPPGTCLRIDRDRLQVNAQKYWSVPGHTGGGTGIPALRSALLEAVSRQYGDGADVGLFLSGGVDSSAVAALACDITGGRVRTFNLAFDEIAFDESPYARQVSRALGTEHHEIRLTAGFFEQHLEDALRSLDQPSFDALNSYMVSRAVHDAGVRVALGGTGGDDLFGGNRTFVDIPKAMRLGRALRHLPRPVLELSSRALARWKAGAATSIPPQTRWGKLLDVGLAGGDLIRTYQVAYALFTSRFLRRLLPREAQGVEAGMPLARMAALRGLVRGNSLMYAIAMLELSVFVGDRLLRDIDSASSAAGLEVRCPLLDERVLDAWKSTDERMLFEPVFSKRALRGAALERLDPALFDRPKAGFVLPFDVWCRQALRRALDDTLSDREHASSLGLDPDAVMLLWQAFGRGEPGLYWSRVWAIFVALWWCRSYDVRL